MSSALHHLTLGRVAEVIFAFLVGALVFGNWELRAFFGKDASPKLRAWRPEDKITKTFGLSKDLRELLHKWKSDPILVHIPHGAGLSVEKRDDVIGDITKKVDGLKASKCTCPPGLLGVFVWTYGKEKGEPLVKKGYEACGCPYVQLDYGEHKWDWFGKVGPVLKWMREGGGKDFSHLLVTDAEDMSFVQVPTDIITRFSRYEADLVFANTMADWPKDMDCAEFEASVNPWSTRHQHLSAGGYMAKADNLMPFLTLMEEDYHRFLHNTTGNAEYSINAWGKRVWDDQLMWRRVHMKYYPRVKIDSLTQIFTRFDNSQNVL